MSILSEIFSWWGGNTWGTRVTLWRQARVVGHDALGNTYYIQKSGVGPLGVPRRWVVYKTLADASKVPAEWHSWLHYTVDTPPSEQAHIARSWEKPHKMNMTGTADAYRPSGSLLASGERPKATGDYKPWRPQQ
jgi:NADH:ubiquinone oxidoreductase subunit